MKHLLTAMAVTTTALAAHPAAAQTYLRGTVGIAFPERANFSDVDPTNATLGSGVRLFGDMGHSVAFGGGIGYRWSPVVRTDLTLTYMPSLQFRGGDDAGLGLSGSGDVKPLVGLANIYLDIGGLAPGTFGRFQPYLGIGAGIARNELGTFTTSVGGVNTTIAGATRNGFAWSGTVGVGYLVTDHVIFDFEYKYFDVGEIRSGTRATTLGVTVQTGGIKADSDIHTVNLGVRFQF
jgi:opacity protein-like surface antigen